MIDLEDRSRVVNINRPTTMMGQWNLLLASLLALTAQPGHAFAPVVIPSSRRMLSLKTDPLQAPRTQDSSLEASAGGKKKRKRRRKTPPGAVAPDPVKVEQEQMEGIEDEDMEEEDDLTEDDLLQIADVANFEFDGDITMGKWNETYKVRQELSCLHASQASKTKKLPPATQMLRFHCLISGKPARRK